MRCVSPFLFSLPPFLFSFLPSVDSSIVSFSADHERPHRLHHEARRSARFPPPHAPLQRAF